MTNTSIYQDIAMRTEGSLFLGILGPVRTGKSTFIKRFMETQVIPNIENVYRRERAIDELPQSGSGKTIMTAEPKFVPEEAVEVTLEDGAAFSVRLIDSVGYMVKGAMGQFEDGQPRMVTTPWFEQEIPMAEAAEIGTRKVITEHSTIGIVITTDGSITDIDREDYVEPEERVISELKELGKPFIVLLNSADPRSQRAMAISEEISQRHGVACMPINCLTLNEQDIKDILKAVLFEFPLCEMDFFLPAWVDALDMDHPIKSSIYSRIREAAGDLSRVREVRGALSAIDEAEEISASRIAGIDLGKGVARVELDLPRELPVPEMDMCVVLSNLLENALEASRQAGPGRYISLRASLRSEQLVLLTVENAYTGEIAERDGVLLSSKRPGEGIGLQSVAHIAEKTGGYCKFLYGNGVFTANVMLRGG